MRGTWPDGADFEFGGRRPGAKKSRCPRSWKWQGSTPPPIVSRRTAAMLTPAL